MVDAYIRLHELGYAHSTEVFMDGELAGGLYGVSVGIEPHQSITKRTEGLLRVATLVESPCLKVNYDTGNAYLCGHDVYAWLERVAGRLVHLHAKDISGAHSDAERGKVTGTPVGCACGDGVINWNRVIQICKKAKRDIVFSVECGTIDQAERSIKHLKQLV